MDFFWKNYQYLCSKKGVSTYRAAQDCGVKSTGTVSYWKNGSRPRDDVVNAMLAYFNVTASELFHEDLQENESLGLLTSAQTADPLYVEIKRLTPSKRALVAAFISGLNANPDISL